MASFLEIYFWLICAALALLLAWTKRRKMLAFGTLNLLALAALFGIAVAVQALVFTLVAWCTFTLVARLRRAAWPARGPSAASDNSRAWPRLATVASFASLFVPIILFVIHKLAMEHELIASWFASGGLLFPASPILRFFQALAFSYVVLRYLDAAHCVLWKNMRLIDPLSLAGFLFPFHMILSGPVNRYDEHIKIDTQTTAPAPRFWLLAFNDISTGLLYKYVIAEYIRVFAFGPNEALSASTWLDTSLLFVYIFFDFAGYSRIVLGVGRVLGIPTPENFRSPFLATSITEFFTRWHISLGTFLLRNVYTPLQLHCVRTWGMRWSLWAGLLALGASWIAVGLWHRLSWLFFAYGLAMALIVWAEKNIRDRLARNTWANNFRASWVVRLVGPVYVFLVMSTMIHLVIGEILNA